MSVPSDILHFQTMETINSIPVDDVTAFIKFTDKVIKIDNTYHHMSHTHPPPTRLSNTTLCVLSISQALPSTNAILIRTSSQPSRSSLVCSNTNCGATGHTIETCFKNGGGLEGKHGQYLASRNCVQAHLAHLTDGLEGNFTDDSEPPLVSLDAQTTDDPGLLVEPAIGSSGIVALSVTPSVT